MKIDYTVEISDFMYRKLNDRCSTDLTENMRMMMEWKLRGMHNAIRVTVRQPDDDLASIYVPKQVKREGGE